MDYEYINNSIYSFDNIAISSEWMHVLNVNGYPVFVIFWNLLLLIIPFLIVKLLFKYYRLTGFNKIYQKSFGLFLGFIWLLFIPNASYIISEIRHLLNFCPINIKYRVCVDNAWMIIFFFTYACIGWIALVYLLNQMKGFLEILFNKKNVKIFIILIIPIISLGLLLGLLNRWNSWEVFIDPIRFTEHVTLYFTDYAFFNNWLIFSLFTYILYYGGNYLFKKRLNKY